MRVRTPLSNGSGPMHIDLRLPKTMEIHDVFHVSLLRPYKAPVYPGRVHSTWTSRDR